VDVCARFGGEELAVLLPNTGGDGAAELAERLRVAVAECRVRASGKEIRVTASFGIATYPSPVGLKADLFAAADRALYTAKGGGRDRVAVAQ
jgi:diguanylate cyclase (GGDEF)-like protein